VEERSRNTSDIKIYPQNVKSKKKSRKKGKTITIITLNRPLERRQTQKNSENTRKNIFDRNLSHNSQCWIYLGALKI
jgi:hypothetical protein